MSSVGIYAITSYAVTQRTQELGLRLALGAQASQIAWLILRTGLVQLGIGLTLGLAAAYGVSQVLKSLVAQIPAVDPVTFIGITAAPDGRDADRVPDSRAARDADGSGRSAEGGTSLLSSLSYQLSAQTFRA